MTRTAGVCRRLSTVLIVCITMLACNSLAGRVHELTDGGAHLHHTSGHPHSAAESRQSQSDDTDPAPGLLHLMLHEASCCGQMAGFNGSAINPVDSPAAKAPRIPHALGLPRYTWDPPFKPPIA